ncbi:MAG: hypothetical protein J0M34_06170 [Alphaproteobacteria bacterium]|nr:hypothetical protein [Alphaproteobacteria bacterium]
MRLFSPKPNETALSFGLTWSMVGSAVALTYLASCAYLIPENPKAPRYNTVMGDKRLPPKNPSPANNFTMPDAASQPAPAPAMQRHAPAAQPQSMMPAPVPQPQAQITPPLPASQEQPFVQNTAPISRAPEPAPAPTSQEYSWWNPRGWFGDAQPAKPMNTPSPQLANNMATAPVAAVAAPYAMQPLPSNDEYPVLQNTPPSPLATGQAQARDKLNSARGDMEAEFNNAAQRANQLRSDAQAEPSLLSSMPPQPEPVVTPSVTRPASVVSTDLPPPAKVVSTNARTTPSDEITVSEPITLKAPQGKGTPIETGESITTSLSTMDPSTSTFDPMAGSTEPITLKAPEGTYRGTRYLPESRYVERR